MQGAVRTVFPWRETVPRPLSSSFVSVLTALSRAAGVFPFGVRRGSFKTSSPLMDWFCSCLSWSDHYPTGRERSQWMADYEGCFYHVQWTEEETRNLIAQGDAEFANSTMRTIWVARSMWDQIAGAFLFKSSWECRDEYCLQAWKRREERMRTVRAAWRWRKGKQREILAGNTSPGAPSLYPLDDAVLCGQWRR